MDNVFIKQHYNELLEQLNRLHFLLSKQRPDYAVIAQIQPTAKSQEHEPVTSIVPVIHSGMDAVELAALAYKDLHTIVGVSQKSARRTPGAIWIDTSKNSDANDISDCVIAINAAKLAIKEYVVSNFSTAAGRFDILKQSCPGVMTVHLYRLIRCYHHAGLSTVSFTWSQQQTLLYPDKASLINKINLALEQSSSPTYINTLSTLLDLVIAVPQGAIRIRRNVKVQPIANIKNITGENGPVTAPLPIIILQEEKPLIKHIGDFDSESASKRKRRSDKLEANLLGYFQGGAIEAVRMR